ncbi:FAD/NAD(P)-binding domain-containing protein [Calocera viscosa TUFC12733]|uniref:FAD/NAD(P)-binding domain-containing protein n=1 Tax=Calocera viscosa (strain TUFC12733) TaxID=1330018 RepID=A0A167MEF7_CALVF|nr:FAD/NAD(P)-binding domain-containing protein [Calocera viscosa TUFC12733]
MASPDKNIVIVGAIAGILTAKFLKNSLPKDYRIVLIDTQDALFYPIAALRAAVIPGWEERIHTPFSDFFGKGSRHIALPGTTVTELKEHSVIVNKEHPEFGLGVEIPYEYCIIATGASQTPPARPAGPTSEEITGYLRACQKTIASATRVLVVGGGPAGIELATEVRDLYPNVGVTLVHRSDKLVRYVPGLHEKVLPILQGMGIDVVLEDTIVWPEGYTPGETVGEKTVFHTTQGRTIEAQYVYLATGNVPNSSLVASIDPSAISKNGCIRVRPTFQVDSTDPRLARVFAVGDVADVPEIKLLEGGQRHGRTTAANIRSLIAGKPATKEHSPRPAASYITLGSHNVILYTPWFICSGWFLSKIIPQDLHADRWRKDWSGGKQAHSGGHVKVCVAIAAVLGSITWFLRYLF